VGQMKAPELYNRKLAIAGKKGPDGPEAGKKQGK